MLYLNGLLLGVALASDAFSVALADGLLHKNSNKKILFFIPLTFALCQGLMSLIGYILVNKLVGVFRVVEKLIPFLALILLTYLGVKMIVESRKKEKVQVEHITPLAVLTQGVATSIDALSVGFTLTEYSLGGALIVSLIIGGVTLLLCSLGVFAGKKFSVAFNEKATLISGIIFILIGIEIFLKNIFF